MVLYDCVRFGRAWYYDCYVMINHRRGDWVYWPCWVGVRRDTRRLFHHPDLLSHLCPGFLFRRTLSCHRHTVAPPETTTLNLSSTMVGKANSILKPLHFILIFTCFDIAALTVQALGGAKAAAAQANGTSTTSATRLMVQRPTPRLTGRKSGYAFKARAILYSLRR